MTKNQEFSNDPDRTFGITDEEIDERFVKIVLLKKEEARIKGGPVQYYDEEKQAPYLLYPDGRREYFFAER